MPSTGSTLWKYTNWQALQGAVAAIIILLNIVITTKSKSQFKTKSLVLYVVMACLTALAPGEIILAAESPVNNSRLTGHISKSQSPFLSGSVTTMPKGTKVDLTLMCLLNSEASQKGDEIYARVAVDVKNGKQILLPGNWYVHGLVTDTGESRRLGRNGFVTVEFDKLISPDGEWELPFPAKFSTKDNELKAVAKVVGTDVGYVSEGALGGAILSVQLTGVPLAIASHGYSVAIGAAAGASLGLIGALKRRGKIASLYPFDEVHLTLSEPMQLPGFNPEAIKPTSPTHKLNNLCLFIVDKKFQKDPFGDHQARMLTMDIKVDNQTKKTLSFFDLSVISDHNRRYFPSLLGANDAWKKHIPPHSTEEGTLSFSVDSPKHKYWLVLLDKYNHAELTRVPVN